MAVLDGQGRAYGLSSGGAADMLATALFLDHLDRYEHMKQLIQTLNPTYEAARAAAHARSRPGDLR
jgi:hypothetical protein